MIKGVNKNIIEVLNPENQYFEKIIFFVKPSHKEKEEEFLNEKAKEYMISVPNESPRKSSVKTKSLKSVNFAKIGGMLAAGAALTAFLTAAF